MNTKVMMGAAILAAAALAGCGGDRPPAPGTATFSQISGHLNATLEAPIDRVWTAAQAAIEELQFKTGTKSKDALTGLLTAKTADNSDVRVRLDKRTDATTDVMVGVGPFGKEATARIVLDKIKEKL